MTIEEIRKNAPQGATHYARDEFRGFGFIYIKYRLGRCCVYSDKWRTSWGATGQSLFELSHKIKPL